MSKSCHYQEEINILKVEVNIKLFSAVILRLFKYITLGLHCHAWFLILSAGEFFSTYLLILSIL